MLNPINQSRIVFMGSPEFAIPILGALIENYNVVGVVTQPDRKAGRGRKLQAPPVKILAEKHSIDLIQPIKLSEKSSYQKILDWHPDLIIVAAFGQILRKNVLNLPKHACLNVHASLLPRWRGAAPIQAAILTGDQVTGATIMRMDEGLDTGPIISQNEIEISITETAGSLSQKLSLGGAELLMKTLPSYLAGKIEEQKQDDSKSTYAPMLKKANGQLDFSLSASALEKQIRAYNPWPGTFANIHGHSIKIHRAKSLVKKAGKIGQLAILENYPAIASKDSWLLLTKLQPPGKRTMDGEDFLRGGRKWEGFATI